MQKLMAMLKDKVSTKVLLASGLGNYKSEVDSEEEVDEDEDGDVVRLEGDTGIDA